MTTSKRFTANKVAKMAVGLVFMAASISVAFSPKESKIHNDTAVIQPPIESVEQVSENSVPTEENIVTKTPAEVKTLNPINETSYILKWADLVEDLENKNNLGISRNLMLSLGKDKVHLLGEGKYICGKLMATDRLDLLRYSMSKMVNENYKNNMYGFISREAVLAITLTQYVSASQHLCPQYESNVAKMIEKINE